MKAPRILLIGLAATSLAGCATSTVSGPVEVTRFHLGAPLERGTIAVEPLPGGGPASLEFSTYAGAVQSELVQAGYNPAAAGTSGQYLAVVGFTRTTLEGAPRPAPFTVGLGGGSYGGGRGGGVGLGGGISFPIGKSKSRYVVATELSVQIRRRSDGTVIWEGRAQTQADDRAPEAQATAAAGKLAHALVLGFPGESGRSITVK
ncbi:hypothetical protein BH11PSE6_BH11PSE6_13860 [soil metagenome]